jgi:type I restriction enzyme M protein
MILRENGILIIILPNGYLTNPSEKYLRHWLLTNYRIIAVISLPAGTFKKSGTGVSSVILFIKKEKVNSNYEIFTAVANKIGFDFNSKLNEKLYQRDSKDGQFILDKEGRKIPDNDLNIIKKQFFSFIKKNYINGFNSSNDFIDYEFIYKDTLLKDPDLVLSPKRNEINYLNVLNKLRSEGAKNLREVGGKIIKLNNKPLPSKNYYYLDIGKIGRGLYILDDKLPGWNLPGRAKQKANLYDIFVSRLNGSSNKFCIIVEDSDDIFVTNGMFKISFSTEIQKLNFFHFLHSKEFEIQFNALATGSIMEDVKNDDFETKILIPQKNLKDHSEKANKIIELLSQLKTIY